MKPLYKPPRSMRATLIGMFTAAAVAGTFALSPLPNVEIITFMAFIAGFLFGSRVGGLVGAFSMFLFSAISPYGSGLGYPFLLATQIVGMSVAGVVGGLLRRPLQGFKSTSFWARYLFGVVGAAVTIFYDIITTIGFMYPVIPLSNFLSVFIAGIPFTVVHVTSNVILLAFVAPPVVKSVKTMMGEVEVSSEEVYRVKSTAELEHGEAEGHERATRMHP